MELPLDLADTGLFVSHDVDVRSKRIPLELRLGDHFLLGVVSLPRFRNFVFGRGQGGRRALHTHFFFFFLWRENGVRLAFLSVGLASLFNSVVSILS